MQALLTDWSGQAEVSLTGASLERLGGEIHARGSG
jgi:hypothetical protein